MEKKQLKLGKLKNEAQVRQNFFESLLRAKNKLNLRKQQMTYISEKVPRPKHISVIGSWDDWNKEYVL